MPEPIKTIPSVVASRQTNSVNHVAKAQNIVEEIVNKINTLTGGLQTYPIRDLVKHAEEFGPYLKQQRLLEFRLSSKKRPSSTELGKHKLQLGKSLLLSGFIFLFTWFRGSFSNYRIANSTLSWFSWFPPWRLSTGFGRTSRSTNTL
jgi:hypothetical protein